VNAGEKIEKINSAIARLFPAWPDSSEERKRVLKEVEALVLEEELLVPEGHVVEVTDGKNLFASYYFGVDADSIGYEIRTSNPLWWQGVPVLKIRPLSLEDEPHFRIRIKIGEEENDFVVRNALEAVSRFEFLLWEAGVMPDYENFSERDEQLFRRTGVLKYGEGPDAPVLMVLR